MQVMTVNYKRILNLGNYESKHLEMSIEIHEDDDIDEETSRLMELVERKIREDASKKAEEEIRELKREIRELKGEQLELKASLKSNEKSELDTLVPLEDYLNSDEDAVDGF